MLSSFQDARLEIEGSAPIRCLFNPREFSVSKTNTWDAKATPGATAATPQFGGGAPRQLSLTLLFDSTRMGTGAPVRDATERLLTMMEASEGDGAGAGGAQNTRRPPKLTFVWGRYLSFEAFATSLQIQYLLFEADGQPIRAEVKLELTQADAAPPAGQNPTTRADAARLGEHLLRDGDTLQGIAHRVYGDATRWRAIAEANGIDDPMRLRRGTTLDLPRIDG